MKIFSALGQVILSLVKVLGVILSPVLIFIVILSLIIIIRLFWQVKKHKKRLPKVGSYKRRGFFQRIFIDFPRQFVDDRFGREDYEFNEYGIHMVCGEQGSGKTTTVVYLLQKWQQLYPRCKVATNMGYKFQQDALTDHIGIVGRTNGKQGQIEVIDEIQTWFSSLNSKNFPVEMLTEISQQRKQRKCIMGTAQVFSRMAKPLREQTHFVYLPMTWFGCITIVRKSHIKHWNDEKQKFSKYTGFFFFVHNKKLRDSFDTYLKIEDYKTKGFKAESERMKVV